MIVNFDRLTMAHARARHKMETNVCWDHIDPVNRALDVGKFSRYTVANGVWAATACFGPNQTHPIAATSAPRFDTS